MGEARESPSEKSMKFPPIGPKARDLGVSRVPLKPEPVIVAVISEDLRLAVKCQSYAQIAGTQRKLCQ